MGSVNHVVVVGGSGFLGRTISLRGLELGLDVTIIDRSIPDLAHSRLTTIRHDLTSVPTEIPLGLLILAYGVSYPRPIRAWNLVYDNILPLVNLLGHIRKRKVVLLSSVEVYGFAEGNLTEQTMSELPWNVERIDAWCDKVVRLAQAGGNSREAMFELCLEMASADATGRWAYALTKLAQERLLLKHGPESAPVVLRLGNVFGTGHEQILTTMIRRSLTGQRVSMRPNAYRSFISAERVASIALSDLPAGTYNVAGVPLSLAELAGLVRAATGRVVKVDVSDSPLMDSSVLVDSSKLDESIKSKMGKAANYETFNHDITDFASRYDPLGTLASPFIALVQPARPQNPKELTERIYSTLNSGAVKYGNKWTNELEKVLTNILRLPSDRRLWVTNSGTSALRLAVQAVLHGRGGGKRRTAVVPAFTFAATAEFLTQLGFEIKVCDVNPRTWTMDETRLRLLLSKDAADLVVSVDALGNPVNYAALRRVCDEFNVPLVADSAPALSASCNGIPVGSQANAHAFSLSFAKVISAGGAGGFVVTSNDFDPYETPNWGRSSMMPEISAAVALDQLPLIALFASRRRDIALRYNDYVDSVGFLQRQMVEEHCVHSNTHWSVQLPAAIDRAKILTQMDRLGIECGIYYSPVIAGTAMQSPKEISPVSDQLCQRVLSLPISSEMTMKEADLAITALGLSLHEQLRP